MIRPAKIGDVKDIAKIINQHASKGQMLPIALSSIYDQLRDFVVATDEGRIVGCGAMHVAWDNLGEIRSIAVEEDSRGKKIGIAITERLLDMAREMELTRVFVLTYQKDFFDRFGFHHVDKDVLPHKIWRACLNCPKFPNCDETALMLEL